MKYAWIDNHRDEYTVSRLCRVLGVSRTGYCQWRVRPPSPRALANEALDAKVALIHRNSRRSYGRPRITQQLRQHGECVKVSNDKDCVRSIGERGWLPPIRAIACRWHPTFWIVASMAGSPTGPGSRT
jgi:hypothetical protein